MPIPINQPGSVRNLIPPRSPDHAIAEKIRALENAIIQLSTARTGNAMTVDGAPGITVTGGGAIKVMGGGGVAVSGGGNILIDGGRMTVLDVDGSVLANIGNIDDAGQEGIAFYRPDGTLAASIFGGFFSVRDRVGDIVLSDDATSGAGLAVPWVTHNTPVDTNTAQWPATTNTAWTQIAGCYAQRQNPGLTWSIFVHADTGTTGQVRLSIDGTVVATSPVMAAGTFALWSAAYYWPHGWTFNSTATVTIDGIVTTGTGALRATTLQLVGVQSP